MQIDDFQQLFRGLLGVGLHVLEQAAFYMVGDMEEVESKAKQIEADLAKRG